MGIRIHAQSIYPTVMPGFEGAGYDAINNGVLRIYEKVLRPDTIVEPNFLERSTYLTSHTHLELLNNAELLSGTLKGEEAGCDVAFIRCGNDPALLAIREALSIPVVAMSESSMQLASRLGSRFAVIGVDDKSIPLIERNIRLYGLEANAISHRPVRIPTDSEFSDRVKQGPTWFESPEFVQERVIPYFETVARSCIDDGAEVIVTGCALFGAFTLAGYNKVSGTEVPVVESLAVGIKTAEMMGDLYRSLGLTTSKHLTYRSDVTPDIQQSLMAPYFKDAV